MSPDMFFLAVANALEHGNDIYAYSTEPSGALFEQYKEKYGLLYDISHESSEAQKGKGVIRQAVGDANTQKDDAIDAVKSLIENDQDHVTVDLDTNGLIVTYGSAEIPEMAFLNQSDLPALNALSVTGDDSAYDLTGSPCNVTDIARTLNEEVDKDTRLKVDDLASAAVAYGKLLQGDVLNAPDGTGVSTATDYIVQTANMLAGVDAVKTLICDATDRVVINENPDPEGNVARMAIEYNGAWVYVSQADMDVLARLPLHGTASSYCLDDIEDKDRRAQMAGVVEALNSLDEDVRINVHRFAAASTYYSAYYSAEQDGHFAALPDDNMLHIADDATVTPSLVAAEIVKAAKDGMDR
ncbi:MAG: hypothetical protein IT567_03430, partial [Alphaproteobacteria bacterium]|nr:hypothetical protein [Alphaproteobacteria bacterium]